MTNEIDGLDPAYATRLYKMLGRYFNEQELRSLMFELGVEYDDLPGVGVIGKSRELVAFMNRRNRLNDLIMAAYKERPQIPWPHPPQTPAIEEYSPRKKNTSPYLKIGLLFAASFSGIILLILGGGVVYNFLQQIVTVPSFPELETPNTLENQNTRPQSEENSSNANELNDYDEISVQEIRSLDAPTDKGLVFVRGSENNNSEIFAAFLDRAETFQLTNTNGQNWAPAWSKDGQFIAFNSDRDGNNEIYVMDAQGEKQVRITQTPYSEWFPTWSPDGRFLAFYTDRDGNREIYIIDLNSEELRRLTNNPADDWFPSWSPDGKQIAFTSERDGKAAIYVMDIDGENLQRLTDPFSESWFPSWSPDGNLIAFHSNVSGNFQLYTIKPDGTGQTRLTMNQANDYDPSWSSDGKWIVFNSDQDDPNKNDALDEREIYVIQVNGEGRTRLTITNSIVEKWVEWQP